MPFMPHGLVRKGVHDSGEPVHAWPRPSHVAWPAANTCLRLPIVQLVAEARNQQSVQVALHVDHSTG